MAGENFHIASWKIENLSCWNQALHGIYIESPEIYFLELDFTMKLYPRGTSGQEDHMVVYLSLSGKWKEFSGDLSFIDAEGFTLTTQRVQSKGDEGDIELPFAGPRFKEAIVESRENVSDRKDQLTLRFQIKSDIYDENHVHTVIHIFDVTMEADPSVIRSDAIFISDIRYVHEDYTVDLYLVIGEDEKIELSLESDTKDAFSVKTQLRFISSVGALLRYENNEHMFQEKDSWAFSESLTKRKLSEKVKYIILNFKVISGRVSHTLRNLYLYFDNLKIISNRYVSVCMEKSLSEPKIHDAITHNDKENALVLSKDLMCLYQDQDFSDFILKCGSVSFPVHRNILSARSTVFKTMLATDMTEAVLDIEDLDPSTLSLFLAFLYTGAVEDLQGESALKLYYAADKYNVPSLKRECVGFLSANVSVSNVCDVLSLGDKHQDEKLTAAAHDFILGNYNEVLKSKEWNSFMCSEPLLAVKTVTHFAAKDFVGNLNPL